MTFNRYIVTAACSFALFAGIASLAPAPVLAGEIKHEPQVTVNYGDLNIARRAGAEVLVDRLRHGAKQVCGEEPFIADLRGYSAYRACVRASLDRAVTNVGAPLVTEAYQRQSSERLRVAGN